MQKSNIKRTSYLFNVFNFNKKEDADYLVMGCKEVSNCNNADREISFFIKTNELSPCAYQILQDIIIELQSKNMIVTLMIDGDCDASILALTRLVDGVVINPESSFVFDSVFNHPALHEVANNPILRNFVISGQKMSAQEFSKTFGVNVVISLKAIDSYMKLKENYVSFKEFGNKKTEDRQSKELKTQPLMQ
jgi:hypothetical protein